MGSRYLHSKLHTFVAFILIFFVMIAKLICFLCLVGLALSKCKVDSEVKFILNNMTPTAVKKNVDCVVGAGPCDSLGQRLKSEAGNAVRQDRCGNSCSCEQVQVRLVVQKMRSNYGSEWQRVVNYHGRK